MVPLHTKAEFSDTCGFKVRVSSPMPFFRACLWNGSADRTSLGFFLYGEWSLTANDGTSPAHSSFASRPRERGAGGLANIRSAGELQALTWSIATGASSCMRVLRDISTGTIFAGGEDASVRCSGC